MAPKLSWVPASVVVDPPQKTANLGNDLPILKTKLVPLVESAEQELVFVAGYFVPGQNGTASLARISESGVDVSVLTNSLESTDVLPVHSHYSRYRKNLLLSGVNLWELRSEARPKDWVKSNKSSPNSGLHAKVFAVDSRYLFIGSFNWDPRSANINTEMGIILDAPGLTREVLSRFKAGFPKLAYRLNLDEKERIIWLLQNDDGSESVTSVEPANSGWDRVRSVYFGLLPVEKQL